MSFSSWLENRLLLESGKKRAPKPVQVPKPESNKISSKAPKQRMAGGRLNTTFNDIPKELRTRGEAKRRAVEEQ